PTMTEMPGSAITTRTSHHKSHTRVTSRRFRACRDQDQPGTPRLRRQPGHHGRPVAPRDGTRDQVLAGGAWPTIARASSAYRLAISSGDSGPALRYQVATAV